MNHLRKFKHFNNQNIDIKIEDIEDIFSGVFDCGLKLNDCFVGVHLYPPKGYDIYSTKEYTLSAYRDKDAKSFKSFSVRLYPKDHDFVFDDDLFTELDLSIEIMENKYSMKFAIIQVRTPEGIWMTSISKFREWFYDLSKEEKEKFKVTSYLDIIFNTECV